MKLSSLFSFSRGKSDDLADTGLLAEPQTKALIKGSGTVSGDTISVGDENDWRARFLFENTVRSLLAQKQFDVLERIAANARSTKARFPGGEWKLHWIYEGLQLGVLEAEYAWRAHFDNLNAWMTAYPDSITAKIAAGKSQVIYAWKARSDKYAEEVPEEAWQTFLARLGAAKEELAAVPPEGRLCPEWYLTLMLVARGEGWERADYDALYEDACQLVLDYEPLHTERAVYLFPRWHGEEGEWQAELKSICQRIGGQPGSSAYFLILTSLLRHHEASRPGFEEMAVSKERLLAGVQTTQQLYQLGQHGLHAAALFGRLFGDKEQAATFLRQLGDDWDEQVWGLRHYFDKARTWAGL